ncbi:MAG TPA: hypothetical protein VHO29_07335 [Marmoricola sp.]|jgi:hypothetical protein|nr:hypothetical protein [Marmoricola sp.]
MAGSQHDLQYHVVRHDRPFWRSPGGWDNGLDDDAWVTVLDVADSYIATLVLFELRQDGVPAYAAAVRTFRRREPVVRLWVGASRYGAAQSSLIRLLPDMVSHLGSGIVR